MLIACPSCQRQLNVPETAAGKQVRCPATDCGTAFFVPAVSAPVVAVASRVVARPVTPPLAPPAAFDFGGTAPIGPEADFGFTEHTDGGIAGIGLRTRLNRAAGWLNMAAGSLVIYTLFTVSIGIAAFVVTRAWPSLAIGVCSPFAILPFAILIVVGGRMLSRGRRWGLALTAAIICLLAGVFSLVFLLVALAMFVMAMIANAGATNSFILVVSCGNLTLLTAMAFCGLFAGVVALRTLMRAEIKATFA